MPKSHVLSGLENRNSLEYPVLDRNSPGIPSAFPWNSLARMLKLTGPITGIHRPECVRDGNALGIPNAFPWNCPVGMPAVGSAQTGVPGVPTSVHSCVLKTTGGAAYIAVRCQIRRENLPLSDSDRGEFLFGFEIGTFMGFSVLFAVSLRW